MKVLVCGGRDFADKQAVFVALDSLHGIYSFDTLIQGGARGADWLAGEWANSRRVKNVVVFADWDAHGRAAGPIRNKQMLDMAPDVIVAFPGGVGTANMVKQAIDAGKLVVHPLVKVNGGS